MIPNGGNRRCLLLELFKKLCYGDIRTTDLGVLLLIKGVRNAWTNGGKSFTNCTLSYHRWKNFQDVMSSWVCP